MFKSPVINRVALWYLFVVLTAVSFTWSEHINSVGIILLVGHWLLDRKLGVKFFDAVSMPPLPRLITILIWTFFFFHLLALLWSDKPIEGWQSIEVKLTFLVLPFLFSTENYLDAAKTRWLFLIFSFSCCLSFVYTFLYSYGHHQHEGWNEIISRMNISEGIMHPGYYSNYFAFALVWCVLELKSGNGTSKRMQIIMLLLIPFLLTALLLLISKTAILFIACFAIYIVWLATGNVRQIFLRMAAFICCIAFLGMIAANIPSIKNRVYETFYDSSHLDKNLPLSNSTGSRMVAWQHEWSLIRENWLTGYGTGEANSILKTQLIKEGYVRLAEENMHTHNQVFHTWLDVGIMGVILLLSILVTCAIWFYRQGNLLGLWLLPLIFLNILTDDMLEVQAGTVFFVFFLTLLVYQKKDIGKDTRYAQ